MENLIDDSHFRVNVISKTERPNLVSYSAMHQDYSETDCEYNKFSKLSESELGDRLIRNCIKKQHWGILEHPSITFNVVGYPHSVMVQARTHRVGVSFDCQSQRYTGKRILKLSEELLDLSINVKDWKDDSKELTPCFNLIEPVFYFRPIGFYKDRQGSSYEYLGKLRNKHLYECWEKINGYARDVEKFGFAPEHARDLLPQNIRQNFVVTFNARSLLHFCDMRLPKDAQLEIRDLATRLFAYFKKWMPEVAENYENTRYGKNKLAP